MLARAVLMWAGVLGGVNQPEPLEEFEVVSPVQIGHGPGTLVS